MIDLWLSHAERDVSNFRHHVPHLIELFSHLLSHFRGGQIGLRRLAWEQLTSDPYVLGMVSGVQFSFVGDTPIALMLAFPLQTLLFYRWN